MQQEITAVRYDPMSKRVIFYTKINGYEIPFSHVYKDLGDQAYLPTNINRITSMTGITWSDITNGQRYIH